MITNVGPVHLELVETIENVARAKAELIDGAAGRAASRSCPTSRCSSRTSTRDRHRPIERVDRDGARCPFATSYTARAPAREHARRARRRATRSASPLPDGELRRRVLEARARRSCALPGGGLLLNDCYNANPVSMRAALEHLAERAGGRRRVAVLGEMAELGDGAPAYHREIGELVARARGRRRDRGRRARARVRRRVGRRRAGDGGRARCGPRSARATSCSSRARARWDSRSSRRTRRQLMARVLVAALVAMIIAILAARLHRVPAPERVRPAHPRGGAAAPRRQAGHADDGRPADPARRDDRVPAAQPTTRCRR